MVLEYAKGQYVVYNGFEICRMDDIVKRCFDGVNEKEYYILYPTKTKSTYYVPTDVIDSIVRPVMTKEQLLNIIDSFSAAKLKWIADRNDRKHDFNDAIKKGDYERIIPLMNGIYNEKTKRNKNGKQLLNDDKRNFELAKRLLHSEIAFVFGMETDKAEEFIKERIKNVNTDS